MFIIGILIHLIFLFSIFDIYFKSPIVRNVYPYEPQHKPAADRLVLFIVDGLRAESFVNYTTMSYLRSISNTQGRWGISHTRVPTESRPGHVAVIAGFYEDPSAVAKGWKENPVDFDSVFNQSSYTWCWGAYDIINIFTKENTDNHIFAEKFNPYDQTFSTNKNTTLLDEWVFRKVENLFENSHPNTLTYQKLHSKKVIFFLHLLGTDTSGHTHKPKTQNFVTTIRFVDENIEKVVKIIKDFYNDDGKTTFLMTSDHGMTDWGSHGTGDDHETQTPYVLWGAGIQQVEDEISEFDPQTLSMSLHHRFDINQADLTPLMAAFLSIPVPVNSIGELPIDLLNTSLADKAKALYSNSRQLLSQYNKKRLDVELNAIGAIYQPYEPLDDKKIKEIVKFTERLLEEEQYEKLIILSKEIMNLSQNGLNYYHNYYQRPLLITVSISFVCWMLYLLKFILLQNINIGDHIAMTRSNTSLDLMIKVASQALCLVSCLSIYVQSLPVQFYIYFLLPVWLFYSSLTPLGIWIQTWQNLRRHRSIFVMCIEVMCYIIGSISLGLSFNRRWLLSVPLLGMGLWPYFSSYRRLLTKSICVAWVIGCVLLSIFSFMPVVGKEVKIELVILAGFIWLAISNINLYVTYKYYGNDETRREMTISLFQIVLLILSLFIIYTQSKNFSEESPISQLLQTVAWSISFILPILPLLYSKKIINRLLGINTSILIFYLLLSVSHEGLFMVTLIFNLYCWMVMEFKLINRENTKINECSFGRDLSNKAEKSLIPFERNIGSHDFRRAFFFTLYIILAYFGTGNIASLNSFEVRWVICFTTSFQPFIITTLILLKTLAPFLCVACSFRAVQHLTEAPVGYLNVIVLIFSNIMGLHLLFYVKNTGSWLEIGTSISQYVIVQVITLFIVLINQMAKWLTEVNLNISVLNKFGNRKNVKRM